LGNKNKRERKKNEENDGNTARQGGSLLSHDNLNDKKEAMDVNRHMHDRVDSCDVVE
jgi:hypothetical protein